MKRFLCLFLLVNLLLPAQVVMAQTAMDTSTAAPPSSSPAGGGTALPAGLNLDLSSTRATLPASSLFSAPNQTATITVGGQNTVINAGSLVTPAEYLAASQVLSRGRQSLEVGHLREAIGGQFLLETFMTQSLSSLSIPKGITAVNDFARNALALPGNLTNAGSLFAVSTSPSVMTANISANNIFNRAGALITTVIPAGGVPGFKTSDLVSGLNLSLTARQSIVNAGTISSAGNLTTQSQYLTNAGLMQASAGSITLQNGVGNTLYVNNAGGLIQARDAVTFKTLDTLFDAAGKVTSKAQIDLDGGVVSAENINFFSHEGIVDIDVTRMDGGLHVKTGAANVSVAEGDLNLKTFEITGDPVIYLGSGDFNYTGDIFTNGNIFALSVAQGFVNIVGNINTSPVLNDGAGGDLLIMAATNITITGTLQTSGLNGNGGQLLVMTNNRGNGANAIDIRGGITTTGIRSGNVLIANNGTNGTVSTNFIDTSSSSPNGFAGAVSVISPGGISIGATLFDVPAINTQGAGPGKSGGIFVSSGSIAQGGAGQAVVIGSATNPAPIASAAEASIILHSKGDIRLGGTIYTAATPSLLPSGGMGVFPRVASAFTGFTQNDTANYTFTFTPQAAPTFTNGVQTWDLIPGGFQTLIADQSIDTSGSLTIQSNGDSRFLSTLLMPTMRVNGDVIGATGAGGSASSIALITHQGMTVANGSASTSVITAPAAGVAGASAGDFIAIGAVGNVGVTVGGATKGTAVIQASNPANTVAASGGTVLIGAAVRTLSVNGDIVTSGLGGATGGPVTLVSAFVPTVQSTVLTVGNVSSNSIPIAGVAGNGANVGLYAGSDLVAGTVNTSGNGPGTRAGDIYIAADNTTPAFTSGPGIVQADDLIAAGLNNGAGGNVWLDSGSGTFDMHNIVTRSTTGTNVSNFNYDTGSGASGDLYFSQNALMSYSGGRVYVPILGGTGTILTTPTLRLKNGANILLDGTRADSTSYFSGIMQNTTTLGDIATQNLGTGMAGSVSVQACQQQRR